MEGLGNLIIKADSGSPEPLKKSQKEAFVQGSL